MQEVHREQLPVQPGCRERGGGRRLPGPPSLTGGPVGDLQVGRILADPPREGEPIAQVGQGPCGQAGGIPYDQVQGLLGVARLIGDRTGQQRDNAAQFTGQIIQVRKGVRTLSRRVPDTFSDPATGGDIGSRLSRRIPPPDCTLNSTVVGER